MNPYYKNSGIVICDPGHDRLVQDQDNSKPFIVYHAYIGRNNTNGNKRINLDEIYFDDDKLNIKGLTKTLQFAQNQSLRVYPNDDCQIFKQRNSYLKKGN